MYGISADSSATRSTHVINQRSDGCSEGNSSHGEGEEGRGGVTRCWIGWIYTSEGEWSVQGDRLERKRERERERERGRGIKSNHAHIYVAYNPMVAPTAKMRLHASLAGARASEQELTERVQRGHERREGKRGYRNVARGACSRALH